MVKRGPKKVLTNEIWSKSARDLRAVDDRIIADKLNLNKSTVFRVRKRILNDPELKKEFYDPIMEYLEELSNLDYKSNLDNHDVFIQIPIIKEWRKKLEDALVSEAWINTLIRGLWRICKKLREHPAKLTIEKASELIKEQKRKYYRGEASEKGFSYTSLRQPVRSFFTRMRKISAEHISDLGVTAEMSKGSGKYANQRISREVREKFEKTLLNHVNNELEFLECLNACKFMYYTASRVRATLGINLSTNEYTILSSRYIIEVIDKGRRGGYSHKKMLIHFAINDFREYIHKRFDIEYENMEKEIPKKITWLFPSFIKENGEVDYDRFKRIIKKALIEAEIPYKDFQPTHIFRHTFAQDFLHATNYNYELCASIGGWKATHVLKAHYGEMSELGKITGLSKAMGIKVEEVIEPIKLRW